MKLDSSVSAVITGGASGLGEATARSLAAFEISIGGRHAIFARRNFVFIHPQTGRTAGFTQVESRFLQNLVDAFGPGLIGNLP